MEEKGKKSLKNFDTFCDENQGEWSPFLFGVRKGAEANAKDLNWDEDIMPVLFVDGEFVPLEGVKPEDVGKRGLMVIGIIDIDMSNQEQKDKLAELIFKFAVITKATGVSLLQTAWMSVIPDVDRNEGETDKAYAARCEEIALNRPMPSQDPNRVEKIWCLSGQYGGPDDGCQIILADIKREEGKPPVLHNWKVMPATGLVTGRFPDAIQGGLMFAARLREAKASQDQEGEEWKEGK